jgi:Pyridoxamine 5'-phosphate oxidase
MIAVVTPEPDLPALARSTIDSNRYMTLGTADRDGLPWVSPVWYASVDYREFFPGCPPSTRERHSRNVMERPEVSIVIFDSQVPVPATACTARWRQNSSCSALETSGFR